jgi:hypothetical protein
VAFVAALGAGRPHAAVLRPTVISAVTMPVGTARMPQPSSIITLAIARPMSVFGTMSAELKSTLARATIDC